MIGGELHRRRCGKKISREVRRQSRQQLGSFWHKAHTALGASTGVSSNGKMSDIKTGRNARGSCRLALKVVAFRIAPVGVQCTVSVGVCSENISHLSVGLN